MKNRDKKDKLKHKSLGEKNNHNQR